MGNNVESEAVGETTRRLARAVKATGGVEAKLGWYGRVDVAKKGGFGNEGPWLPAARDAAIAEGGDGVRHEKVSAPREGMHVEVDIAEGTISRRKGKGR